MAGAGNVAAASDGGLDWSSSTPAEPETMKRATYEDVLNAPENKVAEILDGELFLSPRPAPARTPVRPRGDPGQLWPPSTTAAARPGGWWILDEPELHLGERRRRARHRGLATRAAALLPDAAYFALAPDWVCEVLSPSTERIDRGRKLRIYAEAGVAHAWLVNPVGPHARGAAAPRRRVDDRRRVHCDSDTVRIEPFEAIELELGRLWADPPAPPPVAAARGPDRDCCQRPHLPHGANHRGPARACDAMGTLVRPDAMATSVGTTAECLNCKRANGAAGRPRSRVDRNGYHVRWDAISASGVRAVSRTAVLRGARGRRDPAGLSRLLDRAQPARGPGHASGGSAVQP